MNLDLEIQTIRGLESALQNARLDLLACANAFASDPTETGFIETATAMNHLWKTRQMLTDAENQLAALESGDYLYEDQSHLSPDYEPTGCE